MYVSSLANGLVLGAIAVLAGTLLGLVSLWIVTTRVRWWLRWGAVAATLAVAVRLGIPELVLLVAIEIVTVWIGVRAGRVFRRWREGAPTQAAFAEDDPRRFSLRGALLATGVVAVLLAGLRFLDRGGVVSWKDPAVLGALTGMITLAAYWCVSPPRKLWRYAATLLVGAMCGCILDLGAPGKVDIHLFGDFRVHKIWAHWGAGSMFALTLLAILSLWSGDSRRNPKAEPAAVVPRISAIGRALAMLAIVLMIGLLAPFYYEMAKPVAVPAVEIPNPNAYLKLVGFPKRLQWRAIPAQAYEEASNSQFVQFVRDNQQLLSELHATVYEPSAVPLKYELGDVDQGTYDLRDLARALTVEARLAYQEGRDPDCARVGLDLVRLGRQTARKGTATHELIGNANQSMGLGWIYKTSGFLGVEDCRKIRTALAAIEQDREPFAAVAARNDAWDSVASGWRGKFLVVIKRISGTWTEDPFHLAFRSAVNRNQAEARLLIAELALQEYVARHGHPPEALEEMVPECLASVPIDPFSERPLCYRRNERGWSLYSVGRNGIDDGGTYGGFTDISPGADLLLDWCFGREGDQDPYDPDATDDDVEDATDEDAPTAS